MRVKGDQERESAVAQQSPERKVKCQSAECRGNLRERLRECSCTHTSAIFAARRYVRAVSITCAK